MDQNTIDMYEILRYQSTHKHKFQALVSNKKSESQFTNIAKIPNLGITIITHLIIQLNLLIHSTHRSFLK